jgi:hypothetical protein
MENIKTVINNINNELLMNAHINALYREMQRNSRIQKIGMSYHIDIIRQK